MKVKKLTIALAAVAMMFVAASCGGNKSGDKETANTEVADSVLDVDSLLANADSMVGKDIKVEGFCKHICQHGGGKIFLMGSDSTKIIKAFAGDFKSFDKKCVNSIVYVEGKLVEDRIDEAALVQREEQMKEKMKEQKHGEGEGGCTTSKQAKGIKGNTIAEQNEEFRKMIKEREAKEGKAYLSFYHIDVVKYEIR